MSFEKDLPSYDAVMEQFPGIEVGDPTAIGRFAFYAAAHQLPEEVRWGGTRIDYQPWHDNVRTLMSVAEEWRSSPNGMSRLDFANQERDAAQETMEMDQLMTAVDGMSAADGLSAITDYLVGRDYGITCRLAPSPLFPDGRKTFIPMADYMSRGDERVYISGGKNFESRDGARELREDVRDFILNGVFVKRTKEVVGAALAEMEPITAEELETGRQRYGAKAANLMAFDKRVKAINQKITDSELGYGEKINIPPFHAVDVDMYKAWKAGSDEFDGLVEEARNMALGLSNEDQTRSAGNLVAVRSSAVYSEDGEHSTGAGVYLSVAVDPRDPEAFRQAVLQVYESTESPSAQDYRKDMGVLEDELMGLVIQRYVEVEASGFDSRRDKECFYGHANSRGSSPSIVDVNTNEGTLLYDKASIEGSLLVGSMRTAENHLHTHPDHHTALSGAVHKISDIPHAVVLAERMFGRPIQLEFVNDQVVQVRPLVGVETGQTIEFPDEDHLIEITGVGTGDLDLEFLESHTDNTGKRGYIIFEREYEFSMRDAYANIRGGQQLGYSMFPEEGVVVIMQPSSSGHIQTICRERGLLCLFPRKEEEDSEWDLRDVLFENEDGRRMWPNEKPLRFVSDGYRARIYSTASVDSQE